MVYVDRLLQLFRYVPREQLTIPDFVFQLSDLVLSFLLFQGKHAILSNTQPRGILLQCYSSLILIILSWMQLGRSTVFRTNLIQYEVDVCEPEGQRKKVEMILIFCRYDDCRHDLEVNGGKGLIVDPRTKYVYHRP